MAQHRLDRPVPPPKTSDCGATSAHEPGLSRGIQDHIGSKLRAMYDELKDQPVPDRFLELLGTLEGARPPGTKRDG